MIGRASIASEITVLLDGIRKRYGYDFSNYSTSSLHRRLELAREHAGVTRYTELLDLLFHDEQAFERFLPFLSVTVTEMFRDPAFYRGLRGRIIPMLKTFPFIKIWHAGCATGEEAYSMAILLHEEGYLDRARIYATDFNNHSLEVAQRAVYPSQNMKRDAKNYRASGGHRDFSSYYRAGYEFAKIKSFLKDRITFSYHNLVTDGVFGEMNLILCRNVLIYFDRDLQNRVLQLFESSLRHGGVLCLGSKETLAFSSVASTFTAIDGGQKIYRKSGGLHAKTG